MTNAISSFRTRSIHKKRASCLTIALTKTKDTKEIQRIFYEY